MKIYILIEELSKSNPVCDCGTYEVTPVVSAHSTQTIVDYIYKHYKLASYDIRELEDFMSCTEVFTKDGSRCVSLNIDIWSCYETHLWVKSDMFRKW